MRTALVLLTTAVIATAASAQDRKAAPSPKATSVKRCVDVDVEGRRSYNCLTESLRADTARAGAPQIVVPVDARSPDVKVGTVNMPAVRQQYGSNFGVSVKPYRPSRP